EGVHGGEKTRMLKLRRYTHGDGEIVMTHPGDVQSRNRDDLVQVFKCPHRLEDRDHRRGVVCFGKERLSAWPVKVVGDSERHAAFARRSIFEFGDRPFHLSTCLDAWNHDALCTQVENSGKRRGFQVGYPDHGENFRPAAGRDHFTGQCDVTAPVLHIVNHEIHPARRQHGSDPRCEQFENYLAERDLSVAQLLLEAIHVRTLVARSRYCSSLRRKPSRWRTSRFTTLAGASPRMTANAPSQSM